MRQEELLHAIVVQKFGTKLYSAWFLHAAAALLNYLYNDDFTWDDYVIVFKTRLKTQLFNKYSQPVT